MPPGSAGVTQAILGYKCGLQHLNFCNSIFME
jgi:hypothetical protein